MVWLIISLILVVLLTACATSVLAPTYETVENALAFEVEQIQQQLSQQLDLDFQGFDINRLSITKQQPLTIENLLTYHIWGTYNLTFKLPKRQIKQPQKPFDLYLQLQKEGKTWRLLKPERSDRTSQTVWRSYLIR
ncbi:MAG: hypothetical protein SAK29_27120 [Scytonema sp. PMC 1069.18]|nr:hypothetical protein [Scytonema sp. PMC 1069.18]MEC4885796.1 hypothetical protein [Scytonema sp. PMC 1070.18]